QFLELLKRHGITRIEAQGKPFDPNVHQAVMQKTTDEVEPNTVVQVLEQGFMNQDRVLRPAKVVVSAKPGEGPRGPSAASALRYRVAAKRIKGVVCRRMTISAMPATILSRSFRASRRSP